MKNLLILASLITFCGAPLYAQDSAVKQEPEGVVIEQRIAEVKEVLAKFEVPSTVMQSLIEGVKQAAVSASIGVGIGIAMPMVTYPFKRQGATFTDAKNLIASVTIYNIIHGLIQGFFVGFASQVGTTSPPLSVDEVVVTHFAHHIVTDALGVAGVMLAGDNDTLFDTSVILSPLVVLAIELFVTYFKRDRLEQEKVGLEAILKKLRAQQLVELVVN